MVAFSGGSDSTALLRAAVAIVREGELKVFAAWVDHGIRPDREREKERDFVLSLTRRLEVPCDITEPPREALALRARSRGESLEAVARSFRYTSLLAAAGRFRCDRILTAHTADDQTETILMRVLTGSGTAGLRGIPEDRPPFLRPFLTLPKSELLRYLAELGQDWRDDSTNEQRDYLRNRLRRDVVPQLEAAVPGFRSALSALAEKSILDEDLLSALSARDLPVLRADHESSFPSAAFWSAHRALRLRALVSEAGRLTGSRVPYALVREAAFAQATDSRVPAPRRGRILAEGAGLRFLEKSERIFVISLPPSRGERGTGRSGETEARTLSLGAGYSFLFEQPGAVRIDSGASCAVYWRPNARGPLQGSFDFPLVVRCRLPGDKIAIRGGFKALDELLAEQGFVGCHKDFVPVLEDSRGIVGILGSLLGGRDRYRHYAAGLAPSCPGLHVELSGFGPFLIE